MDWLVVYMAAIALVGILLVWFLLRGRIRLFSIGMMLLGLAASLLLYSQTYIFDNWQGVLLNAGGLLVVNSVAYVHMTKPPGPPGPKPEQKPAAPCARRKSSSRRRQIPSPCATTGLPLRRLSPRRSLPRSRRPRRPRWPIQCRRPNPCPLQSR